MKLLALLALASPLVSADIGTANILNGPPFTPTACYGNDLSQFPAGNLFAAAGEGIWDNGAACGRRYRVKCISPRPCKSDMVDVRIVDRAKNHREYAGEFLLLHAAAYNTIAAGGRRRLNINFVQR
uniref:Ave1 n=1 Tax=Fusarium oxysporum f. sp. physali TaxID=2212625 RepID=A0A2U9DPH2_FUSOX|nr:Ave1 [Fusarium oxysporum f. sp. physali]